MAQVCRVCSSPSKAAIEAALVAGESLSHIARSYGLSRKSVTNHRDAHLTPGLAEAHVAAELERHVDLLAELDQLHRAGVSLLQSALTGNLRVPCYQDKHGELVPVGDVTPVVDADTGEWLTDPDGPLGHRWAQPRIALRAVREVRGTLELLARIEGELEPEETTVTVVFDDEWVTGQ